MMWSVEVKMKHWAGWQDICHPARYFFLLPNALYKLILRIFDCCTIILQLLGKRATEKNYWPVNSALLTGHMTNDVRKRQMSRRQRRASVFCWQCFCDLKQLGNKATLWTVKPLSLGSGEDLWNCCPRPLATVSQIFSTTSGQLFDCSPRSHKITVSYCPFYQESYWIVRNRLNVYTRIILYV